jgi:hypothetical protein
MHPDALRALLDDVRDGRLTSDAALERLRLLPFEDLGYAKLDHHRALRRGFPEVVFGAGKTLEQIEGIAARLLEAGQGVLITRTTHDVQVCLERRWPQATWHAAARCVSVTGARAPERLPGRAAVVCAGTSDVPVAEEAALTLEFHGARVERVYDVGVAGLHRLLDQTGRLRACQVLVVAAGMEGALPSVVGGLLDAPIIAVPTSVGYGASFAGLAALLAMLNSCASGVTVVNIDNGFGAGYAAALILRGLRHAADQASAP